MTATIQKFQKIPCPSGEYIWTELSQLLCEN